MSWLNTVRETSGYSYHGWTKRHSLPLIVIHGEAVLSYVFRAGRTKNYELCDPLLDTYATLNKYAYHTPIYLSLVYLFVYLFTERRSTISGYLFDWYNKNKVTS